MLGNVYNQPEKRIDEREIARISVEFDTVDSSYIGRRVFAAAIEALYDASEPANLYTFYRAIGAVFSAGRIQGIREERAKRR